MATELIKKTSEAFNGGNIQPTGTFIALPDSELK